MSSEFVRCPACGACVECFRNPAPTVDAIIYHPERGVVLVSRKGEPLGYALPGGFIDYGESAEHATVREALEETSLHITLTGLLGVYSHRVRDPRSHTMSTVYVAHAANPDDVHGGDDAAEAAFWPLNALPELVFDHALILGHFVDVLRGERLLAAIAYAE